MDPVSISLGVVGLVPVIVQVIKAFRDLQAGVKTARKCGQKLKDLRFELQVQEHRFLNECVLLLHASCEDKKSTQDMVSDPNHGNWADKSLNARLRRRLQQSYSVCLILIEHIFDDLQSLVADLQGFSEVESLKTPVSLRNLDGCIGNADRVSLV